MSKVDESPYIGEQKNNGLDTSSQNIQELVGSNTLSVYEMLITEHLAILLNWVTIG